MRAYVFTHQPPFLSTTIFLALTLLRYSLTSSRCINLAVFTLNSSMLFGDIIHRSSTNGSDFSDHVSQDKLGVQVPYLQSYFSEPLDEGSQNLIILLFDVEKCQRGKIVMTTCGELSDERRRQHVKTTIELSTLWSWV